MSDTDLNDDEPTFAPPQRLRRTAGRPASRAEMFVEPVEGLGDGSELTRVSRTGSSRNEFDIPPEWRKPGWDYQWETVSIYGQPIDPSSFVSIMDGGWRPVPPAHMPGACPPGWRGETIDRKGMRLFMRPMRLTKEARSEDLREAREARENKMRAALAAPDDTAPRRVQQFEVSVERPEM